MDSLSRVGESLSDVGMVERAQEARGQVRREPKGTPQRRPKRSEPATASGDRPNTETEGDGGLLRRGSGEERPVDQECTESGYSRERTVASIPPKGRHIDIAI
jgi:hypothetical protein